MWWMNTSSSASENSARTIETLTLRAGTNSGSGGCGSLTVRSTIRQKAKSPVKLPATIWLTRSASRLRTTLVLNWLETSVRTTIVSENVSPATVMSEPAIVDRIPRAASASPPNAASTPPSPPERSIAISPSARNTYASATAAGTNQKPSTRSSHRALSLAAIGQRGARR